jgi:UDP-N-acetyl-D-galactosamine dehydrogenase
LLTWEQLPVAEAMIVAVAHREYLEKPQDELLGKLVSGGAFIDVKSQFDASAIQSANRTVWRL